MAPTDAEHELPAIDDQLIVSGQRYELIDGELVYVAPADEPHAELHLALGQVMKAHRAEGYSVALDMLTRTSRIDDLAPDVSVYPTARDPHTGRRQLDELSFEIAATESLNHVTIKAAKLAGRGVRRIFAIDLPRERALEWSHERGEWRTLELHATIEDRCLAVAVPVAALVRAAVTDDASMRAMRLKRHPEFLAERAEGRAEGYATGLHDAVLSLLRHRGLVASASEEAALRRIADPDRLGRLLTVASSVATVADLFAQA